MNASTHNAVLMKSVDYFFFLTDLQCMFLANYKQIPPAFRTNVDYI